MVGHITAYRHYNMGTISENCLKKRVDKFFMIMFSAESFMKM